MSFIVKLLDNASWDDDRCKILKSVYHESSSSQQIDYVTLVSILNAWLQIVVTGAYTKNVLQHW